MKQLCFPRMVELDAVTGLPPRKVLDGDIPTLLRSMGALSMPLCAIMVDIDHFKKFNDKHGHDVGDIVLRHVSSIIRKTVHFRGEAYRYGGEEITVLLMNTGPEEGLATARRLCDSVGNSEVEVGTGSTAQNLSVRISLGVACTTDVVGSELLVSADQALYDAKSMGRNQAVLFTTDRVQESRTTKIDVHFPGRVNLTGGEYILLKKWFSYDNPLNIEARELKDPGGDAGDLTSSLPPPSCGMVEAEIRGRVSAIERRDQHTYFKFEVKNEIIDLMFKYIQDSLNG